MPGDRVSRKEVQTQGRRGRKVVRNCLHSLYAGNKHLSPGTNGEKEWLTSQGKAYKPEEDRWLPKALPHFGVALNDTGYDGPSVTGQGSLLPGKGRSNPFITHPETARSQ